VWASSETILGLPFEREQPAYAPIDEEHPAYPDSSYALSTPLGGARPATSSLDRHAVHRAPVLPRRALSADRGRLRHSSLDSEGTAIARLRAALVVAQPHRRRVKASRTSKARPEKGANDGFAQAANGHPPFAPVRRDAPWGRNLRTPRRPQRKGYWSSMAVRARIRGKLP
jgi:hypothetical protein